MLGAFAVQRADQWHQDNALPNGHDGHGGHFEDFLRLSFELLLILTPFRQVARDFSESAQGPLFVAESGDNDVGPKARTIFANPPTFVFEAAFAFGHFEFQLGLSLLDVFRRIEPGKMLADDFARLPALQPFGSRVPGQHAAFGIQHDDGVVFDAIH